MVRESIQEGTSDSHSDGARGCDSHGADGRWAGESYQMARRARVEGGGEPTSEISRKCGRGGGVMPDFEVSIWASNALRK